MNDPSMLTVKRDIESPPRGWKVTIPQTGVTVTAPFFTVLKSRVAAHMKANSIAIPADFDEWCEDAACRESGHGSPFCGGAVAPPDASMPALSFALAARFLNTMLGVIRDRKFVSREEAERRAVICCGDPGYAETGVGRPPCPLHRSSIGGCGACSALFRKVERSMRAYPLDPRLGWCGACGCKCSVKSWIENDTLDRAEKNRPPYHESCWRNESAV